MVKDILFKADMKRKPLVFAHYYHPRKIEPVLSHKSPDWSLLQVRYTPKDVCMSMWHAIRLLNQTFHGVYSHSLEYYGELVSDICFASQSVIHGLYNETGHTVDFDILGFDSRKIGTHCGFDQSNDFGNTRHILHESIHALDRRNSKRVDRESVMDEVLPLLVQQYVGYDRDYENEPYVTAQSFVNTIACEIELFQHNFGEIWHLLTPCRSLEEACQVMHTEYGYLTSKFAESSAFGPQAF